MSNLTDFIGIGSTSIDLQAENGVVGMWNSDGILGQPAVNPATIVAGRALQEVTYEDGDLTTNIPNVVDINSPSSWKTSILYDHSTYGDAVLAKISAGVYI